MDVSGWKARLMLEFEAWKHGGGFKMQLKSLRSQKIGKAKISKQILCTNDGLLKQLWRRFFVRLLVESGYRVWAVIRFRDRPGGSEIHNQFGQSKLPNTSEERKEPAFLPAKDSSDFGFMDVRDILAICGPVSFDNIFTQTNIIMYKKIARS